MRDLYPLKKDDEQVNSILEIANSFQKSRVLLTACEIDLFTHLGNSSRTASEIAGLTGADERALERLMNALCVMGLLEKENKNFSNSEPARKCLVKGSPYYLGNLKHLNYLWDSWSNLTESVIRGTAYNLEPTDHKSPERVEAFIAAMHHRASVQAPEVVNLIEPGEARKILDLGGGSGAYAMEMARKAPQAEVFVFDLPNVIPLTQTYLDSNPNGSNVKTIAGNYMTDSFGKGYDLVLLSSIIHSHSIWENIHLVQKVFDSLNRGGRIVIQDFIIENSRCQPPQAVMFSLNMLVNTKSGDTFTETEIWFLLREAWFSDIKRIDTSFGTSLVIGKK
jgi:SAM-dependent methyltransferase